MFKGVSSQCYLVIFLAEKKQKKEKKEEKTNVKDKYLESTNMC